MTVDASNHLFASSNKQELKLNYEMSFANEYVKQTEGILFRYCTPWLTTTGVHLTGKSNMRRVRLQSCGSQFKAQLLHHCQNHCGLS